MSDILEKQKRGQHAALAPRAKRVTRMGPVQNRPGKRPTPGHFFPITGLWHLQATPWPLCAIDKLALTERFSRR